MRWPHRRHGVEHLYRLGPEVWAARCRCRESWVARGPGARARVLQSARLHAGSGAARTWPRRGVIDLTDRTDLTDPATRRTPVPAARGSHRGPVAAFAHLLTRR